jgi:Protein of unknown function (DUF4239)
VPDFLYEWPIWISGSAIFLAILAFALTCLFLVRRHLLPHLDLRQEHELYRATLVQSMMVFYGLLAALLSVNVYATYADASRTVSKEATGLAALYRDVSSYPEPARSRLQGKIRDYVREIIEEAWPLQRHGRIPEHGVTMVDAIQDELTVFEAANEAQRALHAETLRAYNAMVEARNLRLDANRDGMPALMWVVLLFGAVLCLFGACFFDVSEPRLHFLFQGLLASVFAIILFMTFAWDRPYRGDLGVDARPYQIVYDHLMKRHEVAP